MASRMPAFMSVKTLAKRLQIGLLATKNLRVLDATMNYGEVNGKDNYLKKHIPEAQFFDMSECSDTDSPYHSFMLPTPERFTDYVENLGVSNKHHVVVYDYSPGLGIRSSPRLWWMFHVFGHNSVSILNGGLIAWENEGHDVTSEVVKVSSERFKARYNPKLVKSFDDVIKNLETKDWQLVDARSPGQYNGEAEEPREDIKPGHIPGSNNIKFTSILNENTGLVKTEEDLRAMFANGGVDLNKPAMASCSMGVTSPCISAAAHMCGKDVPVYVGSWTEYYQRAPHDRMVFTKESGAVDAA